MSRAGMHFGCPFHCPGSCCRFFGSTILKRVSGDLKILAVMLGIVFLDAGLSVIWALSALLVTVTSGLVIANIYRDADVT